MIEALRYEWRACADGDVEVIDDEGHVEHIFTDMRGVIDEEGQYMKIARLIAAAPEMYGWLKCILEAPQVFANMPNLQEAVYELLSRINGEEADE